MSSTAVDEPVINILRVLLSALEKYVRQWENKEFDYTY